MVHFLIYSTDIRIEYFKHAANSPFFSSSKCRLFHNATFFGSCIIHILYTGVLKFKRKFRRQSVNKTLLNEILFYRDWSYKIINNFAFLSKMKWVKLKKDLEFQIKLICTQYPGRSITSQNKSLCVQKRYKPFFISLVNFVFTD